jgi:hypothetical protein
LDDDRLRAYLGTLPVPQQVRTLLSLEWEDRLRVIKNAPVPKRLVGLVPDEEILLTMKGVGEEDTLDLIALTSPTQLQFLLDVELWSGDSLNLDKVARWLEYLIGCGEGKVIEFVQTADRDLLVLLLMKLVYLIPNEERGPVPADAPSIMSDEYFTILSRIPKETENTKLLLRVMRQWDRDAFYSLLFEAYGSAGPEAEEKALRWRNARLEEKGLLEFDEAIEIYGYVAEEEARRLAATAKDVTLPPEPVEAPSYPVRLGPTGTFVSRVLASITDRDTRNRIRSEVAFSANRLLVADAREIGDLESMRSALERLFSHVNIGLLFLTGGDTDRAREMLMHLPIRDLFHVGVSRPLDLKSRAVPVVRRWWPRWRDRGFTFLSMAERAMMQGLMQRVPQYWTIDGSKGREFRDFQSMDEVRSTGEGLDEIVAAADACFGLLGVPAPADAGLKTYRAYIGTLEDFTLCNLLATGFVNFQAGGAFEIGPVGRDLIKEVFEDRPEGTKEGGGRLKQAAVNGFFDWLRERTAPGGVDWHPLERFASKALRDLEDELGGIRALADKDLRYIRSVVIKRESGGRNLE